MADRIIKGLGGLYTVKTPDRLINCKPRGVFRKEKLSPLPGDLVEISAMGDEGVIEKILPRKNTLIRPPVANVDTMFIVVSTINPKPSFLVTDKLIGVCEENDIEPILCFNKTDLLKADELNEIYSKTGIEIINTSAAEKTGIELIKSKIEGKLCAFGGNSGVGKSSLLNSLGIDISVSVGDTSKKIERGRHTTKHVELFECAGGFIADTPGFGDVSFEECLKAEKGKVDHLFREFIDYLGCCRFADCVHINEPGCAVKEAVFKSDISPVRYESYKEIYAESLTKREKWE